MNLRERINRIFNKTPTQNKYNRIYDVEINSDLFRQVLQSKFIGEGVYAFEQFSMPDNYCEQYLVTPTFDNYSHKEINKEWHFDQDLEYISVYELQLMKPSFLPLNKEKLINLFDTILHADYGTIVTQLLLSKRVDNWREHTTDLYEEFLKGNDYPVDNKMIRGIHTKTINFIGKMANFDVKRKRIEEIEEKILENNYRFECRFILYDGIDSKFVEGINKILLNTDLHNELRLVKFNIKKSTIIDCLMNRTFQPYSVNQLLSESEIYSLFTDEKLNIEHKELAQPRKVSNVTLMKSRLPTNVIKFPTNHNDYLSQAIKFMPLGQKMDTSIGQETVRQIKDSFKRVKITDKPLDVVEVFQGVTLTKVQLKMPIDVNYTQVEKNIKNIQFALANENITIEIGDIPDTVNIYMPRETRDVLYFRNILESAEFQEYSKTATLPFIIGENTNGKLMFGDLTELRHLLVAGTTGSGKSVFVNLIIICLLLTVPPDEISIFLIDPKQIEFESFKNIPQVKKIITDMKKATDLLESLCIEMEDRYTKFAQIDGVCKELATYNQKSDVKMPYIICAIDEFADLMMVNNAVEDYVMRLGQKARAAGIHLIIATQRPSVDVITGTIKANLPNRFAFAVTSHVDSKTILDKKGAESLLGKGDGLAKIDGNKKEFERFQSPMLTLDKMEEGDIYEKLVNLFKDIEVTEEELPEVIEEEPLIDKLKRIIATTGETRTDHLRSELGVRINVVSDLIKELVEEGWLVRKGRGYELSVSDEELSKWREL